MHLAKFLPPQVAGTSGTVSADLLVGLTLSTIEQTPPHEPKFGCVLDLKKCYNLIPRLPMCMMLAALKIPLEYIIAFDQMLQSMKRTFIIMNGAGDLHQSFTGIAEGCSFSVTCMCALSLFASWQITAIPSTLPVFFADNWSAITGNPATLQQVLHKLGLFADKLRMEFSAAKSWVWTSGKRVTKALKALRIQGELIPFKSQSVDLGCDVTYRGRMGTTSRNKRFGKARNVLKTIQAKKLPYKFRRTAVKLAGHGLALYGAEVVYVPPKKWHSLRSSTASALGVGCGGSNPFLALGAVDPTLDPQFRALIRRIKFWRRAFRVFPHITEKFLRRVSNPRQSKIGPAGAFRQTFLDVGCTCSPHGWMVHHTGWKLHWTQCSRSFLHHVLAHAWSFHICEVTQHRKQMDIASFDITWQGKFVSKANLRQQSILQNYMSGRHITNDFVSKFVDGVSSTCKYCDQIESRIHLLLDCPHFQQLRHSYGHTIQWLRAQANAVPHYGLCPWNGSIVTARLNHEFQIPFCVPEPQGEQFCVFTDGSASFTQHWDLTLAAGAFIVTSDRSYIPVAQGSDTLPGADHSSYRGEVFALLLALNRVWGATIHTDCSAVEYLLNCMIVAHAKGREIFWCEHWDLWGHIWEHVRHRPPQTLTVVKVPAHKNPQQFHEASLEHWFAHCNNKVDEVAKLAVKNGFGKLHSDILKEITLRNKVYHHMESVWEILEKIAVAHFDQQNPKTDVPKKSSDLISQVDLHGLQDHLIVSPRAVLIDENVIHQCPYTSEYGSLVVSWARQIEWPDPNTADRRYTSFLELYIDCYLTILQPTPVQMVKKQDRTWGSQLQYALRHRNIEADNTSRELALQSKTWTRVLQWLFRNASDFKEQEVRVTPSMKHLGYRLQHTSIPGRARLVNGTKASEMLARFFHTTSGRRVNLRGDFVISAGGG